MVAIDKNESELLEPQNEALKIIMDATDLKFLPKSFNVCTAFFSLMYIPNNDLKTLFEEVNRVLKSNGRFLIWDVEIPEKIGDYMVFLIKLEVKLPTGKVDTGYGTKWKKQDLESFQELALKTRFKIQEQWKRDEIFFLELVKK